MKRLFEPALCLVAAGLLVACSPPSAGAQTPATVQGPNAPGAITATVQPGADLGAVLKSAKAGDVIALAPGVYPPFMLQNTSFATPVIIRSADPARRATLKGVTLRRVAGVTFQDLDAVDDAAKLWEYYPFRFEQSQRLGVARVSFSAIDYDRSGLMLMGCSQVSVTDSGFRHLGNGVVHSLSDHVSIERNRFEDMGYDAIHGSSSFVTVRHNFGTGFKPQPGAHPDFIQFFDEQGKTPTDIVIEANLHVQAPGTISDNIFLELYDKVPNRFERVRIVDNLSIGAAYHGVTVVGAVDLTVTGNLMLTQGAYSNRVWIGRADRVHLKDNTAAAFIYGYRDVENGQTFNPATSNTAITVGGEKVDGRQQTPAQVAAAIAAFRARHPQIPR